MSELTLKKELHEMIDRADERFLNAVYALMQNYLDEEERIVAYRTDGTPLTQKEFSTDVRKAYQESIGGAVKSTVEFEREIEKWEADGEI